MGYRSNVRILITKEDFDKLLQGCKTRNIDLLDTENLQVNTTRTGIDFETKNKIEYKYFGWDDIKWYTEFEDVGYIDGFIRELDEVHFIRIGEELDDIKEFYNLERSNVECIGLIRDFEEL